MTKIRTPQPPPDSIFLWELGTLRTVDYGDIPMTESRLRSAFANYLKRGRHIAFSWEHPEATDDPELRGAPAVAGLQLVESDGVQPMHLVLSPISWTERAAGPVGRGEWPWISPEFRVNGDELQIEKIALTTNPQTCGAIPIVALAIGAKTVHGAPIKLAIADKPDDEEPEKLAAPELPSDPAVPETPVEAAVEPAESEKPSDDPVEPEVAATESEETKHIAALKGSIAAIMSATDMESVRMAALELAAIVSSMDTMQTAEQASMAVSDDSNKAVDNEADDDKKLSAGAPVASSEGSVLTTGTEDEMSDEDKKKLAIMNEHFSGLTASQVEAKMMVLKLAQKRADQGQSVAAEQAAIKLAIKDAINANLIRPEDSEEIAQLEAKGLAVIQEFVKLASPRTPTNYRQPVITGGINYEGEVKAGISHASQQSYQSFKAQTTNFRGNR